MESFDSDIHQIISAVNWRETVAKLTLFTERRLRTMIWLGILDGPLPQGHQAHDFVQAAIVQFLSGERQWNKEKVSFLRFLMGSIRSRISHLVIGYENTRTSRLANTPSHNGEKHAHSKGLAQVPHLTDPYYLERSDEEFAQEREQILADFADDPLVQKIATFIIDDDIETPKILAAILGEDPKEIYKAKKRLKLRVRKWQKSQCIVAGRGSNDYGQS